eukprot:4588828-Amphidinium_carterae.1
MGSDQPLPAVKNEPGSMPLSKADARATQQKLLTYLKRDVKRGDTAAQAAQAAWSDIISCGDESSRLAFLKEFAQNASQHGSKKWSWTSSTSREATSEKLTAGTLTGSWRSVKLIMEAKGLEWADFGGPPGCTPALDFIQNAAEENQAKHNTKNSHPPKVTGMWQ